MAKLESRLALVGRGIEYSLSPRIHLFSARVLNIPCEYDLLECQNEKSAVRTMMDFMDSGGLGFNVTAPYKKIAAKLHGGGLSSVNLVYRDPSLGVKSASVDGEGFENGLRHLAVELAGMEKVVIIGAGGACIALLDHFKSLIPKVQVTVLRRSASQDQALRKIGPSQITFADLGVKQLENAINGGGQESLLVQASSAPLFGDNLEVLCPALEHFGGIFVDLVYGRTSSLYAQALRLGMTAQDGLPMLIEQARLSQKLWWGKAATYESIREHLLTTRS